jgi:hypothetical protein
LTTLHDYAQAQSEYPVVTPTAEPGSFSMDLVQDMYQTLRGDRANVFDICHKYFIGDHTKPYAPRESSDQIRDLQERSITNWIPLLVNLPSQVSFVDGYRRGSFGETTEANGSKQPAGAVKRFSPEYECWQRNGMDAKQAVIYRAALTYGHAFVHVNNTDDDPKKIKLEVLSTRNTIAYFDDPINDVVPAYTLTIKSYPRDEKRPGLAILWDEVNRYELEYSHSEEFKLKATIPHELEVCPVVRYTCYIDDEGATSGVIRPIIPMQDRVNQAAFSTNITSDYGAFKVRTAAGLQVNFKIDPATGEPLLDPDTGRPIPEPIAISQAKLLVSGNPDTKFGQLDETPIAGYLLAEDQATKNLAAIAQFPLHALLGNVSNLSAEALNALEAQFMRFLQHLHTSWGDSHEQLFRLISKALNDQAGAESFGGEVRWRDMSSKAFGAMLDGLAKGVESLGIPQRAAWSLVPGITSGQLQDWEDLKDDEQNDMMLNAVDPLAASKREAAPSTKPVTKPAPTKPAANGGQ